MYSIFAVNPAVSCKKIEPVKMNFPIIRVIPEGKCMQIFQIVPNNRNSLQDTAEIVKY